MEGIMLPSIVSLYIVNIFPANELNSDILGGLVFVSVVHTSCDAPRK